MKVQFLARDLSALMGYGLLLYFDLIFTKLPKKTYY